MSTQFETFEYLDGYSLFSIFYGMNQRLNDLLRLYRLHIEFNKHKRDKKIWHTLATVINPEQCSSFIGRNLVSFTQWKELIEKYFPRLKHLTLEFPNGIDEDLAETFYTKELCPTKTVVMKMMVNKAESRYRQVKTIYFNHQWHFKYFDYCKNKNQNDNYTLQSRSSSSSDSNTSSKSVARRRKRSSSSSRTPPRSTSKHQLQLQKKMQSRS
ncbi:unnamed protein product [Adineta steineri]|uniref:Uncharacterized protein n=1 Tax=Adineta steineri TaxID=433720 RepID=A0A815BBS0_9BILA|nr:unnamed protein product [Adineta steineri]